MPLPCTVHVSRSTWYREVNMFKIFMIFVSWINKQEEHCLSSDQILASKYQSIVDNRMKIERASDVVDVMEYSTLNYCIALQNMINETASWMALKSSELQDCSWWISTVLVSLLVSSSSCHAFLPLFVRPMMTIQEVFLKIVFDSPEFNRSIIFSG